MDTWTINTSAWHYKFLNKHMSRMPDNSCTYVMSLLSTLAVVTLVRLVVGFVIVSGVIAVGAFLYYVIPLHAVGPAWSILLHTVSSNDTPVLLAIVLLIGMIADTWGVLFLTISALAVLYKKFRPVFTTRRNEQKPTLSLVTAIKHSTFDKICFKIEYKDTVHKIDHPK